jgi:hypothetical protein
VGFEFIQYFNISPLIRAGFKEDLSEDGKLFVANHHSAFGPANIESDVKMTGI